MLGLDFYKIENVEQPDELEELHDMIENGWQESPEHASVTSLGITFTGDNGKIIEFNNDEIPDEFDWRDLGAVTPIADQGACGACWSFMTTAVLEGAWHIKNGGNLLNLSE